MSAWKENRLRLLRFERRLSQHKVAQRLRISQAQYWKYETAVAEPDDECKGRIAKIFRVPVEQLTQSPEAMSA